MGLWILIGCVALFYGGVSLIVMNLDNIMILILLYYFVYWEFMKDKWVGIYYKFRYIYNMKIVGEVLN